MAYPIGIGIGTPIYGRVTSFPIHPGNYVQEKLGRHHVVSRFIAAYSVFDVQFCQLSLNGIQ